MGSPATWPATEQSGGLTVYDFGPFPGNTPELGLMLITNGDRGAGNRGGATQDDGSAAVPRELTSSQMVGR